MRKKLIRAFILTLFICFAVKGFSISDKIRVGIYTSPGISWAKPFGSDLTKGKPRFGIDFGFTVEYWFTKNYGFTTGLAGAFEGCNIAGRNRFEVTDTLGNVLRTVNEKYNFAYVELPAYLKLKTNPIKGGKFNIWGQVGFTLNITASARATYNNPIPLNNPVNGVYEVTIEKENILKKSNSVSSSIDGFRSNFIDFRLGAGAGFEYKFDDRTSLVVGLLYHNGFINNIIDHDAKKEPIVMRFMSLRLGVLF